MGSDRAIASESIAAETVGASPILASVAVKRTVNSVNRPTAELCRAFGFCFSGQACRL